MPDSSLLKNMKIKIGSLVLEDCSERELPLVVLCLDGYYYLSATVSNKLKKKQKTVYLGLVTQDKICVYGSDMS